MSVSVLNKTAVKEARSIFYRTCDASRLSDKDLLILLLEPLMRDRSLSLTVDTILQKGLQYLASLTDFEISSLFGLNVKQSFHLMTVFEMARRISIVKRDDEMIIHTPKDARDMVSDLKFFDKEHFVCLFLNSKNRVIGRETISVGTLDSALVHPREVFKAAIRRGAASVIFAHNHPSGDPCPSNEDIQITHRLSESGDLLGISVLDHLIIGGETYSSLKEKVHFPN